MNEREREVAVDQLASGQVRMMALVDGLTADQWTFRPSEGRWSIGECVEHVTRVENRILGLMEKKIEGPPEPGRPDSARELDLKVAAIVPDRTNRREAPEAAKPLGQWLSTNELLAEYLATRARTAQFAAGTKADLRTFFLPHGFFGELDCYQWLMTLALHNERHARQIEEIKANAAFPQNQGNAAAVR
jgi:uncharacterized damage-inducible protein DinB